MCHPGMGMAAGVSAAPRGVNHATRFALNLFRTPKSGSDDTLEKIVVMFMATLNFVVRDAKE